MKQEKMEVLLSAAVTLHVSYVCCGSVFDDQVSTNTVRCITVSRHFCFKFNRLCTANCGITVAH